jgi:hypothetical protein
MSEFSLPPLEQAARWIPVGRGERALELLSGLRPSAEGAAQTILALTQLNRLEEAGEAMAAAERDYGADEPRISTARARYDRTRIKSEAERTRLLKALDYIARLPGEPHPAVFERSDYIACQRPGARTVIVSLGIWLPLAAEDLLIGSMGYSAVHVPGLQMKFRRDPLWVIENRDAIAERILDQCKAVEADWMMFIGASGQGMGAISFAARMKADGILAFAPGSSINPEVLQALQDMRSQGGILAPVLAATERVREVDCLVDLQASPTEMTVVYDPAHPFDSVHAERLARAPHVRLEVVPGEGHHVAQVAVAEGLFEPMLKEVFRRTAARKATGRHFLHQHVRRVRAAGQAPGDDTADRCG